MIWGEDWDALLARDHTGLLQKRMGEAVDGEYQTYITKDGAYIRKNFFGECPTAALAASVPFTEAASLSSCAADIARPGPAPPACQSESLAAQEIVRRCESHSEHIRAACVEVECQEEKNNKQGGEPHDEPDKDVLEIFVNQ